MAENHVNKRAENNNIFKIFDVLLKANQKRERACAALVDYIKCSDEKIGSSTVCIYSAKRLIRGLAANEPEKQNIFFATLCTTLSTDAINVHEVISALQNIIESIGSGKSEQNAITLTTVLTYGAIVKSGKWSALNFSDQHEAIKYLLTTCNSKSYIKSAACSFLVELFNYISKEDVKLLFVPSIKYEMDLKGNNPVGHEFLAACAALYLQYPKSMQKVIDTYFGGRHKLLKDLIEYCFYLSSHSQQSMVRLLFLELVTSGRELIELWKNLLEKDHKLNQKWNTYILLVAKTLLDIVPGPELVVQVMQPKLLDIILQSLQVHDKKSKNCATFALAKQVLEKTVTRMADKSSESNVVLNLVKVILGHPSGLRFDRKTRTNTVHSLICLMDPKHLKIMADEFASTVSESLKKNSKVSKSPKETELMLSLIVKLLNHSPLKKDHNLVLKYCKFIFEIAFLKKGSINPDLRSKTVDWFFKSLVLHQIKIEDAVVILDELVKYADEKLNEVTVQFQPSELDQWNNMLQTNKKLSGKLTDKKYVAVRLLLLHMGLLMFRDQALASTTIEELLQCYQRIKNSKKKKQVQDSDEEPHWVEVTVDLLLSMLSRENKLLRHVVTSVFPSMCTHLTATALQQIVDALDPGARNDVLKHMDSDDSDDNEDDAEGDDSDEDDDIGNEDSAGSALEGEEETVNDKLRMAVRYALGYSAALTDDESVDMDDMNEEEEKRLNESLANAFRLFKPGKGSKKKQSKDDEALMHFRLRVLDLVEIIISNNPPLASCVDLLNPLFTLLEFSIKDNHQKPLQNRLEAVLKKMGNVKKFENGSHVTYKDVVTAFKTLFERETSGLIYMEMAPVITECCCMLVRAAQLLPQDSAKETLEDVCSDLLFKFFKTNDRKISFSTFQAILRLLWDGNWHLSQQIMTLLLEPDLKLFKKLKLMELLDIFYKNDRLHSTATDYCKKLTCTFEDKFVRKLAKTLEEYEAVKSTKLLPTFYGRLLPFIQLAIQSKARYRENCSPAPAWASVISHLVKHMDYLPQQKTRNKLMLLARLCNVPLSEQLASEDVKCVGKKRQLITEQPIEDVKKYKAEDLCVTQETNIAEKHEQKKRRGSTDKRKLKKESRDLREAASSQGLGPVNFSSVDLSSLPDDALHEKPFSPEKKKRKT